MALDQEVAPICWAEIANDPKHRIFAAFKWENGKRVQSRDPATGAPLYDRRPLRAHYGNSLTGVRDAGIVSTEKYLRHDGIVTDVKINNSPAHYVDGDDRYQRNITRKARHFGWIKIGECPALQVSLGAIEPHRILSDKARTGPCTHDVLGKHNPPCPHFLAEYEARSKRSAEDYLALLENFKSAEAKQIEAQAKSSIESVKTHDKVIEELAESQKQLVAAVSAVAAVANAKGGK